MNRVAEQSNHTTIVIAKIGTEGALRRSKFRKMKREDGTKMERMVVDRRVFRHVARNITKQWGTDTAFGENTKFAIISSGARELGRLTPEDDPRIASGRGQIKLMRAYARAFFWANLFRKEKLHVSQDLLETSHLHDEPTTGVRFSFLGALKQRTIPIGNENDTQADVRTVLGATSDEKDKLTAGNVFGENDKLAAEVAIRINRSPDVEVAALVFMSQKNGIDESTERGTGGVEAKGEQTRRVMAEKIPVYVVNAKKKNVLRDLVRRRGTVFEDAVRATEEVMNHNNGQ
jgi:glutamate 5-kinase